MKVTVIPVVIGKIGSVIKRLLQKLKDLEICGQAETIQTTAIEIDQNTKKSPADLRRFAIIQTPEENHRLTLV